MARLRPALTLAAALPLWAGAAAAQPCHEPAPLERRGLGLRVGVGAEYATYRTARYEGDYQGLSANVQYDGPWARLRVAMPTYQIERNGLVSKGLGDLLVDARVPLVHADDDALTLGPMLSATLPTGDADRDLGMGHVMLMPGAWAAWAPPRAFVAAQLNYGQALGAGGEGHSHHGGPRPIVNPMNASEFEMAASAGYLLHDLVRARAGAYGALPVGSDDRAAARAAAFAGVDLLVDRFDLGLEGHLPIAGDPFLAKIALTLGARF
jgi:hypothetical protein